MRLREVEQQQRWSQSAWTQEAKENKRKKTKKKKKTEEEEEEGVEAMSRWC